MKVTVNGLVLGQVKLREADRILTLLTPELGVISVSAKGSMRPKNKLFSASGLFSYSEWTLHEGKTMYTADEAAPIQLFFGLRESIEALSVASYIAEMLRILSPIGPEAAALLKLALNSLYLLCEGKKPPAFVKAVFELRSLSQSGYQPDLDGCAECGQTDGPVFLDFANGTIICAQCAAVKAMQPNVPAGVLAAMRHIGHAPDDKLFAFALGEDNQRQLNLLAERYLLFHLDYPPKTLSFLKTLLDGPMGAAISTPQNT